MFTITHDVVNILWRFLIQIQFCLHSVFDFKMLSMFRLSDTVCVLPLVWFDNILVQNATCSISSQGVFHSKLTLINLDKDMYVSIKEAEKVKNDISSPKFCH